MNDSCYDTPEVDALLKELYFTFYTVDVNIEFGNLNTPIDKSPLRIADAFNSQFQLNLEEYRDNNNFLQFNDVTTQVSRWNPYGEEVYKFFKVIAGPVWISTSYTSEQYVSTDGGKTYDNEEEVMLFGTYFFLSNTRTIHMRSLYNIVRFLSEIGGIQASVMVIFGAIGTYINRKIFMAKMMSEL